MSKHNMSDRFVITAFIACVIVAVVLLGGTLLHITFGPSVALYCPVEAGCFGYALLRGWLGAMAAIAASGMAALNETIKGLK